MLIDYKNVNIYNDDKLILSGVNFTLKPGEFVYIIGKVGSGKSTLFRTIYGEQPVDGGEATVLDYNMRKIKQRHIPLLRRRMGIVFQDFQLLSDRTVERNLDFVLRSTGWKKSEERRLRIDEVLNTVDLQDKKQHFPHELSGGEQQRIAIARALLNTPEIILADEPTGNLDAETSRNIMNTLKQISAGGTAVVMITHNLNVMNDCPGTVYVCKDGKLELEEPQH